MSDEKTSDLRWLIDRNHAETSANIAKVEAQVAAIPAAMDRYVLQRVYDADERAREVRFRHLEEDAKSTTATGKAWVLGIGLAAAGGIFGWLAQVLAARGGH